MPSILPRSAPWQSGRSSGRYFHGRYFVGRIPHFKNFVIIGNSQRASAIKCELSFAECEHVANFQGVKVGWFFYCDHRRPTCRIQERRTCWPHPEGKERRIQLYRLLRERERSRRVSLDFVLLFVWFFLGLCCPVCRVGQASLHRRLCCCQLRLSGRHTAQHKQDVFCLCLAFRILESLLCLIGLTRTETAFAV